MKATRFGLLIGLVTAAGPAAADDSSSAILAFGLVGAWSVDCSTSMALPCDDVDRCFPRLIFTVPLTGDPIQQVVSPTAVAGQVFNSVVTIKAATRTADNLIKITTTASVALSGPDSSAQQTRGETWETVYSKQGTGLRVWSARELGGSKIGVSDGYRYAPVSDWKPQDGPAARWQRTNEPTPTLAKCAN